MLLYCTALLKRSPVACLLWKVFTEFQLYSSSFSEREGHQSLGGYPFRGFPPAAGLNRLTVNFDEGGKPEYPEKTTGSQIEINETQPTKDLMAES